MPELREVETVRRGLVQVMEGRRFVRVRLNRPDLRFAFPDHFTDRLTGQTLDRLDRRAKFLIGELSSGERLLMHLGMSGSFIVGGARAKQNPKHDHVIFEMSGGGSVIYNDPRRFGFMELLAPGEEGRLAELGPEPLSNRFNGLALAAALEGRKSPVKTALLDQRIVAGLGNIYVCEALYAAHILPHRPAGSLTETECEALVQQIKAVLARAIAAGGSSLKDFVGTQGTLGYFQHSFFVYDRGGQDCLSPDCSGVVERLKQSGRSTFFCPRCQK